MPAYFYTLRLESGVLYPGATTDLELRYAEHLAGAACWTTMLDAPKLSIPLAQRPPQT